MRTSRKVRKGTGRISRPVIETLEQRQLLDGVPTVAWSTYLGGSSTELDFVQGVACDSSGNLWVVGQTNSSDWTSGGFDISYGGDTDGFVAKINADGTLAWSSYLGGSNSDVCSGIAFDANGNAWIVGSTATSDWVTGGFGTSYGGGGDGFVAKINADGTLAWSSYLGGRGRDFCSNVAFDTNGNAFVTGYTESSGWASGGFDTSYGGDGDDFVAKISADGTLAWSSYLGGSNSEGGYGIALDAGGNAWLTGYTHSSGWISGGFDTSFNGGWYDAFVAKINGDGTLAWSSYLGGSAEEYAGGIALDAGGNAWVVGDTTSPDWASGGFDTTFNGAYDGFVARMNADGTLAWTSYLGGSADEFLLAIALDAGGNAWVTGNTCSSDWASGGFDTTYNGGSDDGLVARISADGTLAWTSYLGGSSSDDSYTLALDANANLWVGGYTYSSDFASGGFDTSYDGGCDGFVAKIRLNHAPTAIDLSSSTVHENQPAGTAVGTISTNDPDPDETFTYTLVNGLGSADNTSFTITGNTLHTAASFDYEAMNSYSIRVRSTDSGGLTFEWTFTISVTDVEEIAPTVATTSINDGAVQRSLVTRLTVTFSEPVTLAPGALSINLSTGQAIPGTTIRVTRSPADVRTYILTFSGSAIIGSSLPDGIYDLTVTATGVQDLAGNLMTANYTQRFHRLFGDSDGNRIVNALDYARLKQTFGRAPTDPLFYSAFDYEGNTLINALDLARFRQRYGMSFSY